MPNSQTSGAITISYPEIDSFYKELETQTSPLPRVGAEKAAVDDLKTILFRLLDENGVILIEKESNIDELQTSVDVSDFPEGKYYLHIISKKDLVTEEIVISR